MVFFSEIFLFVFLPLIICFYYIIPNKFRNFLLVLFSLFFYSWKNIDFLKLLLCNILINYFMAFIIGRIKVNKTKKFLLIITILLNLYALFYYKYLNFIIDIFNNFISHDINFLDLMLPIGISFYTFQGLSYVIDVYRNEVKVQNNILKLTLYISFFPQLVAGPIVRYKDLENFLNKREVLLSNICYGVKRFVIGLSKKVILADSVAIVADQIWQLSSTNLTSSIAWTGIIFYSFQIYFDFSGYSDMAIGLGKMFGFNFPENFRYPYIAKNITDFWRRWHITLSSWFKDYIYIPLGGNKKHVYRNIFVVFLLTGIWHGANYTFIFWGLWHGFFNILEKVFMKNVSNQNNLLYKIFSHIYVLLIVLIGWVFFRADNIDSAIIYLKAMFTNSVHEEPIYQLGYFLNKYNIFIVILCMICSTPLLKYLYLKITKSKKNVLIKIIEYLFILILLVLCTLYLVSSNYNPFIYFQF